MLFHYGFTELMTKSRGTTCSVSYYRLESKYVIDLYHQQSYESWTIGRIMKLLWEKFFKSSFIQYSLALWENFIPFLQTKLFWGTVKALKIKNLQYYINGEVQSTMESCYAMPCYAKTWIP